MYNNKNNNNVNTHSSLQEWLVKKLASVIDPEIIERLTSAVTFDLMRMTRDGKRVPAKDLDEHKTENVNFIIHVLKSSNDFKKKYKALPPSLQNELLLECVILVMKRAKKAADALVRRENGPFIDYITERQLNNISNVSSWVLEDIVDDVKTSSEEYVFILRDLFGPV